MDSSTVSWPLRALVAIFLLPVALLAFGCSPGAADEGASAQDDKDELRIVSFSPAISRTLVDLGLESHVVGRSPFCTSLDPAIPVAGDLMSYDAERLVRLDPTHLLVQPTATGVDPVLQRLADERGWTLGAWHLHRLDDIERMLNELPATIAPDNPSRRATIQERVASITGVMRDLFSGAQAASRFTGRTLLIFNTDPVSAFGLGSYPSDLLLALGGSNATTLRDYPQLTLEDVTRLDPEAVVLVTDRVGGQQDARTLLGPVTSLSIEAAREGHLAVLAHPEALLPSSAIIDVGRHLGRVLERFEAGETNFIEEGTS